MWNNYSKKNPDSYGAFLVFGTVNKGTNHQQRTKFIAFWDGEQFVDREGEDLTYINESVEYWFDFGSITDPEETPVLN